MPAAHPEARTGRPRRRAATRSTALPPAGATLPSQSSASPGTHPEPRAVYGPESARPARTVEVAVASITGPGAGVEEGASSGPSATLRA